MLALARHKYLKRCLYKTRSICWDIQEYLVTASYFVFYELSMQQRRSYFKLGETFLHLLVHLRSRSLRHSINALFMPRWRSMDLNISPRIYISVSLSHRKRYNKLDSLYFSIVYPTQPPAWSTYSVELIRRVFYFNYRTFAPYFIRSIQARSAQIKSKFVYYVVCCFAGLLFKFPDSGKFLSTADSSPRRLRQNVNVGRKQIKWS